MKKAVISATLGLSIIASGLAVSATASAFTLKNLASVNMPQYPNGLCLGLAAGTPTNGTRFILWNCDHTANQSFSTSIPDMVGVTNPTPGSTRSIFDLAGYRQGLGVSGGATNDGANIILWSIPFTNVPQDQNWTPVDDWHITAQGTPCYRFINQKSGKALGVLGGNMSPGAQIVIWQDFDSLAHPDQFWCVQ